ncbi:MAG TPA: SgcJ/EcaC family oxidoreductase [Pseudonocardiaceae bacterium]|nr:SgcJ/EcaC family oxidoreductase [Pseudonocardiaceae bacterium]
MTSTIAQPTKNDMAAIASLLQRMIAAWAIADAESIANLFVDDGTLIIAGTYCAGRAAIKDYFTQAFQGEYKNSQVTGKPVSSRFFGPDAGVLVSVGGVLEPGETEVSSKQAIRASWTVVRQDGEWRLAAYQNTPRDRVF